MALTERSITVLSFRDRGHLSLITDELIHRDNPIAFHGWGVSGMTGRVDRGSESSKFWTYKEGRPLGSKIPLLEPPEYAVKHIDWESVHPNFRNLKDPRKLREIWQSMLPFHLIFPYKEAGRSLSEAVVTPAYDKDAAPDTPVPTICLFWVEDPALKGLMNAVKKISQNIQLGVSSLNDHGEQPPFTTAELKAYFAAKGKSSYRIIVEDPLLEELDIASSHSQLQVPLKDQKPIWVMKRRGSLSLKGFHKSTGLPVRESENMKLAARRSSADEDLDHLLHQAAKKMRSWHRSQYLGYAKELFERLIHLRYT